MSEAGNPVSMKRALTIGVIAVVVAASGVVYWRHATSAAQNGEPPDLLLYAPPDAKGLAYIDLAALRSSPFFADLRGLAPTQAPEREYQEFVSATGFDYERDLDRVVIAAVGPSSSQDTLAVAEGRFDHGKITAYALRSGKVTRANGAEIYEITQLSPGKPGAMAFLAPNRIALTQGPDARVLLISLLQHGAQTALDPALRARLARVAGSPLFGAGKMDEVPQNIAPGGIRSDQLDNLARQVRWVTLAIRPDGEILNVAADGECQTQDAAHQLAGTLDGLRILGQTFLSDSKTRAQMDPRLLPVFDALLKDIRVTQDGERVRLTLELTHAEVRQFLHNAGSTPASSLPAPAHR
jgi:hypothetical protein